jgi:pyruvate kinase
VEPLVALTPVREVRDQVAVSWGTTAVLVPDVESAEDMVQVATSVSGHWPTTQA